MNKLEKLKKELAEKLSLEDDYGCDSGAACKAGFDAASAEYEKIIAELEGALEYAEAAIAVFTVTAYGQYNSNDSSLLEVKKALQKLKEFRND